MRSKNFRTLALIGVGICSLLISDTWASSVSPSELFLYEPAKVLMVDGKDRDTKVNIRVWLDTADRSAFDFGFMNNGIYLPFIGKGHTQGKYSFAGGAVVDFALRNKGSDGLFGTQDDFIYRLSDSAGYASQHYFGPINPSKSRNPVVSQTYFQDLSLKWDLNLDGKADAHALLEFRGSKYDGMMPSPMAVPLPAAAWLFGSGLIGLAATLRRRSQAQ